MNANTIQFLNRYNALLAATFSMISGAKLRHYANLCIFESTPNISTGREIFIILFPENRLFFMVLRTNLITLFCAASLILLFNFIPPCGS